MIPKKIDVFIAVITVVFIWALYFANGTLNGEKFELRDMKVGIAHYILYLSKIGITKLIIGYIIILISALFFRNKTKNS